MTFEKGTLEFLMMQDFFLLVKKFAKPIKDNDYWLSMVDEFDKFAKKYEACEGLAMALSLAFMNNRDKNYLSNLVVDNAQGKQEI